MDIDIPCSILHIEAKDKLAKRKYKSAFCLNLAPQLAPFANSNLPIIPQV